MGSIGRNDPCPCGSGAKYKRCCLDRDRPELDRVGTRQRPTAVEAIASRQEEFAERLRARADRYAQLLGKSVTHRHEGTELLSESALTDEERAEVEKLAPAAFVAYGDETEKRIGRLRELVAKADPLHVLSVVKARNVLVPHGAYYEPTHHGLESQVELVAGLVITQPPSPTRELAGPELLRDIAGQLTQLQDVLVLRNFAAPRDDDPILAQLRFGSALHWMSLRGTSFEHHGRDLARAILEPYDDVCRKRFGFTVNDALHVGEAEQRVTTELYNELLAQAFAIADDFKAKALDPIRRAQFDSKALARLDEPGMLDRLAFGAFTHFLEQHALEATAFTVDDLVDDELSEETIEAVLAQLSVAVGELEPDAYRGPFDPSPLVERPFVESEGRYVLPVPGMVLRDTLNLFEKRLLGTARNFSRARAKTLDALAVRYLTDALPGSRGFTNLDYDGTELDGLVLFDRTAILVEGKGKPLSPAAQRGDMKRLRSDLIEAVEEAWDQGKRAREYLLSGDPAVFVDERGDEIVSVDRASIDDVIIVNPTLHQLAGHASQLPRLQKLGLFKEGEYPWSVFINDLRVITETAGNPAVLLHYLTWRGRLPLGERLMVGDELDLWSSYLLCDRLRGLHDGGHHLIGNASTDFDAFYNGLLGNGPPSPRPRKMVREPVESFVERMAADRPAGWLQAAGTCLEFGLLEMAFVCGRAEEAARAAHLEQRVVMDEAGRVRLVGLPRGYPLEAAMEDAQAVPGGATFHVYVRLLASGGAAISWAATIRPVTTDLSEHEKRFLHRPSDAS